MVASGSAVDFVFKLNSFLAGQIKQGLLHAMSVSPRQCFYDRDKFWNSMFGGSSFQIVRNPDVYSIPCHLNSVNIDVPFCGKHLNIQVNYGLTQCPHIDGFYSSVFLVCRKSGT